MSTGIGDTLRNAREDQGRTLDEASRHTSVRREYLQALEEEDFGVFGGDVYAKGFLSTYARYLDVDPSPLLEEYRRHVQHDDDTPHRLASGPVATAPRSAPPAWIAWTLVGVVVLVGIIALGQIVGGRAPEPADDEQVAAPATEDDTETEPSPADTPTEASPSPSPTRTFEGVNLLVALEEKSWMRVTVDGRVVLEAVVDRGETRSFDADEEIVVRFGNAGGVQVEVNGEDLGTLGQPGEVKTVTFTEEGVQEV